MSLLTRMTGNLFCKMNEKKLSIERKIKVSVENFPFEQFYVLLQSFGSHLYTSKKKVEKYTNNNFLISI